MRFHLDSGACAGVKVWIITETDRSVTTILLQEKYKAQRPSAGLFLCHFW